MWVVISPQYIGIYCLVYPMVIRPKSSLGRDLKGASHTIGGIFRGQAMGNVFNYADSAQMDLDLFAPVKGKVYLFISNADPATVKPSLLSPSMMFKQDVGPNLAPILQKLARLYAPISCKIYLIPKPFITNSLVKLLVIIFLYMRMACGLRKVLLRRHWRTMRM